MAKSGINIKKSHEGLFSAKAARAGMSVLAFARKVLSARSSYDPSTVRQANFALNASKWNNKSAYGGPVYRRYDGGDMIDPSAYGAAGGQDMGMDYGSYSGGGYPGVMPAAGQGPDMEMSHGANWSNGMDYINAGGTHEQNPNQGVQMGMDEQGTANLVEQGEVVVGDYVFSNRLVLDEQKADENGIQEKYIGMSFADIAKEMAKESKGRENDPISNRGLDRSLSKLHDIQESVREENGFEGTQDLQIAQNGNDKGMQPGMEDMYGSESGEGMADQLGALQQVPGMDQQAMMQQGASPYGGGMMQMPEEEQAQQDMYAYGGRVRLFEGLNSTLEPVPGIEDDETNTEPPEELTSEDLMQQKFNTLQTNRANRFNTLQTNRANRFADRKSTDEQKQNFALRQKNREQNFALRQKNREQNFADRLDRRTTGNRINAQALMSTPLLGNAINLVKTAAMRPDQAETRGYLNRANNMYVPSVRGRTAPSSDYMRYQPSDINRDINTVRATAGAYARSANGTNAGNQIAANMAYQNQMLNNMGQTMYNTRLNNNQLYNTVQGNNAQINAQNAQNLMSADAQNAQNKLALENYRNSLFDKAMENQGKQKDDLMSSKSEAASGLYTSLANRGQEIWNKSSSETPYNAYRRDAYGHWHYNPNYSKEAVAEQNQFNGNGQISVDKDGNPYIMINGREFYLEEKKACGGKINRRKKI